MAKKNQEGTIYLRGSTYWIKFYRNGKPFYESSHSEKVTDARYLLAKRLGEKAEGKPAMLKADKTLMRELFDDLLRYYENKGFRSTPILEMKLDKYLRPFFGDLRAHALSATDIERYKSKRRVAGAANATINRELSTIRTALNRGMKAGKIMHMPKIEELEENNIREGFFEEEQYQDIRKLLPEYVQVITDVAKITGFRKGELLSLTWGQIDFKNNRINLRALDTKNKTARFFPMTAQLRGILAEHRAKTEELQRKRSILIPWVFHRNGVRVKDFYSVWRAACLRAKYPGKLIHDFRRTAVRNFVRKGIPERVAMLLSGHKTREVFERYNIVSESDLVAAGEALEKPERGKTVTKQLQPAVLRSVGKK